MISCCFFDGRVSIVLYDDTHQGLLGSWVNFSQTAVSGVASQKFGGGDKQFGGAKMFYFRRITLFCLEKRLSKHKMSMFSKNLGGMAPLPPLATPMTAVTVLKNSFRN